MSERTIPNDPIVLGGVILGLRVALVEALKELAAANDNRLGQWLDALEERVEHEIKSGVAGGAVSIDRDVETFRASLDVVGDVFADLRVALTEYNSR